MNKLKRYNHIQKELGIDYVEQNNYITIKKEDFERISSEMERLKKQSNIELFRNQYLGQWVFHEDK